MAIYARVVCSDEFFIFFSPQFFFFLKMTKDGKREREGRCLISLLGSGHIASDLFLFTQLDRIKEDKVKKERGLKVSLSASFPLFRSAIYTLEREKFVSFKNTTWIFYIKNSCSCSFCWFRLVLCPDSISLKVDHLFLSLGVTECENSETQWKQECCWKNSITNLTFFIL